MILQTMYYPVDKDVIVSHFIKQSFPALSIKKVLSCHHPQQKQTNQKDIKTWEESKPDSVHRVRLD